MKSAGAASPGLKLSLQLGLIADNDGVQQAAKSASSPGSSSYGKYPSLSTLASKYGATSSVRNAVAGVFKPYGNTATADVTRLRMSVTISISTAQKLFGTKWELYRTSTAGQLVALPVNTPKLPKGLSGNVDTIAGLRLNVSTALVLAVRRAARRRAPAPSARRAWTRPTRSRWPRAPGSSRRRS